MSLCMCRAEMGRVVRTDDLCGAHLVHVLLHTRSKPHARAMSESTCNWILNVDRVCGLLCSVSWASLLVQGFLEAEGCCPEAKPALSPGKK